MGHPLRLGVLVSGGGRTMVNLAHRVDDGTLPATVAVVISSRAGAPAVALAARHDFETRVAVRRDHESEAALHDAITSWLVEHEVGLVCLCGYVRWFRIDEPFVNRVMNIHPALLPNFGGKGMFGPIVHRAVLDSGEGVSGCTVHFVDNQYDHGPIILQRTCPVLPGDDEHSLAARVFEQECLAYPDAIRLFAEDRLRVCDEKVTVLNPENA